MVPEGGALHRATLPKHLVRSEKRGLRYPHCRGRCAFAQPKLPPTLRRRLDVPLSEAGGPGLLLLHVLPPFDDNGPSSGAAGSAEEAAGASASAPLAVLPLLLLPQPAAGEVVALQRDYCDAAAAAAGAAAGAGAPHVAEHSLLAAAEGFEDDAPLAFPSGDAAAAVVAAYHVSGMASLAYDVGDLLLMQRQVPGGNGASAAAAAAPAAEGEEAGEGQQQQAEQEEGGGRRWRGLLRYLAQQDMPACLELCLGRLQRRGLELPQQGGGAEGGAEQALVAAAAEAAAFLPGAAGGAAATTPGPAAAASKAALLLACDSPVAAGSGSPADVAADPRFRDRLLRPLLQRFRSGCSAEQRRRPFKAPFHWKCCKPWRCTALPGAVAPPKRNIARLSACGAVACSWLTQSHLTPLHACARVLCSSGRTSVGRAS